MSISTDSQSHTSTFSGRPITALAIGVAAFGSAALNIWGATHIFPNLFTAVIIGSVVGACEVIAALSLRHIMPDYSNNHYWKARIASVILVFAIAGCVISGKQAFHVLFLEANHAHTSLEKRADARQEEADVYKTRWFAGELDVSDDIARGRWERQQDTADAAILAQKKAKPPHEAIVFVLLALFEMVKIGGLWAIATEPNKAGMTWAQRRRAKITEAKKKAGQLAELRSYDNVETFPKVA